MTQNPGSFFQNAKSIAAWPMLSIPLTWVLALPDDLSSRFFATFPHSFKLPNKGGEGEHIFIRESD
jgi:hypothetical protein